MENVLRHSTDVCVCVRKSEGGSEECVCFTECENGNVIEKVQEVKEKQKGGKRKSRLGDHARETFFFLPELAESCALPAREPVCVCARGGKKREKKKKKNLRDGGLPRPSRWRPRNHAPLKGVILCMRFGFACVHARVGRCRHTGVALGLHLPVCVYVRGIRREDGDDDDAQQLEFHREASRYIAARGHEAVSRCRKVRR